MTSFSTSFSTSFITSFSTIFSFSVGTQAITIIAAIIDNNKVLYFISFLQAVKNDVFFNKKTLNYNKKRMECKYRFYFFVNKKVVKTADYACIIRYWFY